MDFLQPEDIQFLNEATPAVMVLIVVVLGAIIAYNYIQLQRGNQKNERRAQELRADTEKRQQQLETKNNLALAEMDKRRDAMQTQILNLFERQIDGSAALKASMDSVQQALYAVNESSQNIVSAFEAIVSELKSIHNKIDENREAVGEIMVATKGNTQSSADILDRISRIEKNLAGLDEKLDARLTSIEDMLTIVEAMRDFDPNVMVRIHAVLDSMKTQAQKNETSEEENV